VALFSHGATGKQSATLIGDALAAMAFGLVPFSLTLLQTRVFYAMKDARTPAVLQLINVITKIALSLLCVQLLDPDHVVLGLSFVNSLSYVVSAVAGNWWLHHRLGGVRTARLMTTSAKTLAASVVAAGLAYILVRLVGLLLPAGTPASVDTWLSLLLGSVGGLAGAFGLMVLFRVEELRPVVDRVRRLARR
jgi:putative peptidoglycan lipid II flippase